MSTDDEHPVTPEVPRTRAEMRAAREVAAAAAEAESGPETTDAAASAPEPSASVDPASVEPAPVSTPERVEPVDEREAAMRAAMFEAAAAAAAAAVEAARPSAGVSSRSARSTTGVPARSTTGVPARSTTGAHDASTEAPNRSTEAPRSLSEERSDETKRSSPASTPVERPARSRRFAIALTAVLGILVLVGAGLGVVSLTQGPRITSMQVDPTHAIESSGSRVILTANQSLAAIDDSQVTVTPAVPFTVDASGRGIGIRFTVPLDDATKYTVKVADVEGAGGGPSATLTKSFATPASTIFLLRRDAEGKDSIFLTDLTGEKAVPVFTDEKINDFRATATRLVVSVEEDEVSKLYVMDRDGKNRRELTLPGTGYIGSIQVSDRGGLVGYTYSDQELSDTEGRASVLVTQSLSGEGKPQIAEVAGKTANVLVWNFVPDSAAMLFIDFDGALSLIDHSTDAGVQSLGLATDIQGISRGTYTAIVERLDGSVVELNLADGSEQPLAASNPDYGMAISIVPFPGGTLRHIASLDDAGMPNGQAIVRVDDDGTATKIAEVGPGDSILQACASPSGQYAAVAIAPELVKNPYDQMLLPLPQNIETHLIDLRTGDELVALTGFDASWCATAPHY